MATPGKYVTVIAVTVSVVLSASCGARTGLDDDLLASNGDGGVNGDGSPFGDSGADTGMDAAVTCTPGVFVLNRAQPAVMLTLDRSRSMAETFGSSGQSRWDVLTDALASSLPPVDATMALGALAFPDSSAAGSCNVAGAPDLTPALGQSGAIVSLMRTKGTGGSTPTADAIDVAAGALVGFRAAATARAIVLATDGGPDCNAGLDPSSCRCVEGGGCNTAIRCLDDARTETRIKGYAAQGIPTYVIGIQSAGDNTNSDVLDAMAVAGGRPQTGTAHRFYAASSGPEIESALVAIRNQVGGCTYLTTSVPGTLGTIVVTVGGKVVPFDPTGTNGWKWADQANGEISFFGDVCTDVAQSGAMPSVNITCGPVDDGGSESGSDASSDDDSGADAAGP